MLELVIDTENTGAQRDHAHPFNLDNKCCLIGMKRHSPITKNIEYDDSPYGQEIKDVQDEIEFSRLVVAFNLKYDLHWLRRYGIRIPTSARCFDVQLVWFILRGQRLPFPSLDQVAEYYGLEKKLDVVKLEYWDKGLDTDDVPLDILTDYLKQDLEVTWQCYLKCNEELERATPELQRTVSVALQDLVVLADMEWNGMFFNAEKSERRGDAIADRIADIDSEIRVLTGCNSVNANSGDHISAILYGGIIDVPVRQPFLFTYKDGRQVWKERWGKDSYSFDPLVKPPKGSELAKLGYYSTSTDTLKALQLPNKKAKQIVSLLLKRSGLEQQRSTYFHGYPKQMRKHNWNDGIMHSQLNQCVARTGRLSSSKPNLQNAESGVKEMFETRFK